MSSFVTYCGAWEADGAIFDTRFTLHLHVSQQNDHPCLDICGFVADGLCSPSKVIVLIDCVETLGVSKEEQSVFTRIRLEELLWRGGWPCGGCVVSQLQQNTDRETRTSWRCCSQSSLERSHRQPTKGATKQTFHLISSPLGKMDRALLIATFLMISPTCAGEDD